MGSNSVVLNSTKFYLHPQLFGCNLQCHLLIFCYSQKLHLFHLSIHWLKSWKIYWNILHIGTTHTLYSVKKKNQNSIDDVNICCSNQIVTLCRLLVSKLSCTSGCVGTLVFILKKKTNLSLMCNRRCMYISSQKQSVLLLTSL